MEYDYDFCKETVLKMVRELQCEKQQKGNSTSKSQSRPLHGRHLKATDN